MQTGVPPAVATPMKCRVQAANDVDQLRSRGDRSSRYVVTRPSTNTAMGGKALLLDIRLPLNSGRSPAPAHWWIHMTPRSPQTSTKSSSQTSEGMASR